MTLTESHYHSDNGDNPDNYQYLDVVVEAHERQYIRFTLMETRWRSKKEAAAYLRWAAKEIEQLPDK